MDKYQEYQDALKKAKKYKYKGLKLEDTGIYDTLEEAVKYAKRYQDVRNIANKKPYVNEVIDILTKDNYEENKNLIDLLCFTEYQNERLSNLIPVLMSKDTKQLEINLKRKIISDLRVFFQSGYYLGNGYDKDLQPLLDRIYEEMKEWFLMIEENSNNELKEEIENDK